MVLTKYWLKSQSRPQLIIQRNIGVSLIKLLVNFSAILGAILLANTANAILNCSDVTYGSDDYFDNMEKLAVEARLPDNYFNRYHESVISDLCKGDTTTAESWIDNGYVKRSEVEAIKEVLGLDERSSQGSSYQYSREKFSHEMGLSSAFSDNVAQYYTQKPNSKCGKLAKSAIEGNPRSIKVLQDYPEYCIWRYDQ